MEFNLKISLFILLTIVIFSCKEGRVKNTGSVEADTIPVTDTTIIGGRYLELLNNKGKTELRIDKDNAKIRTNIAVSAPSYFMRLNGKKVFDYAYPDVSIDHTLVIVGDIITAPRL